MKALARRQSGASIAEASAALCLLLPLVCLMIFAIVETSYAYLIKDSMAQAARQAARDLAIAYGQNPAVANDRSLQDALVFDHIRIQNLVNNSEQFDDPVFETASNPAKVRVTVRYLGGRYGLPTFPHSDPLGLGNSFIIFGGSTYRLE